MVLSNKKLKEKLRAETADSTQQTQKPHESTQPNQLPPESLKPLLDSAAQKHRLSKREKRRETQPTGATEKKKETEPITETKKRKKTEEDDGVLEETHESDQPKKKKKKKKRDENNGVSYKTQISDEEKRLKKKRKLRLKKKSLARRKKRENKEKEKEKLAEAENEEKKKATETIVETEISQPIENVSTKVYAGGIPYYSTEDDIRSFFESCGTITEVDCMTFPESGKFRGIAIISFKTETAAKRALALDGSDMGGLFLTIQPFKTNRAAPIKAADFAPRVVEGYRRIYIGNLSWDITDDALKSFFSGCNISSVRLGTNKDSGEFRGYAHVNFSDDLSFTTALKLDQRILLGRPVKISCAVPMKNPKTSPEDSATVESVPIEVMETEKEEETEIVSETVDPAPLLGSTEPALASVSTGKIRRRTCYVCSEKGHISSECPKSVAEPLVVAVPEEPKVDILEPAPANAGSSAVSAGKMRRRTCYECGGKGHLSSDCPTVKDGNKL